MSESNKETREGSILDETTINSNPILQFNTWFDEVEKAGISDANSMNLSTSTPDGRPSSRIVLLKELNAEGFIFYTNYQSQKGLEIESNPFGALSFYWKEISRQVRIEGPIEKVSFEKSDEYFKTRPRGSQIGAWSSPQSNRIEKRIILEEREAKLIEKFKDKEIPRPAQWGGYILLPEMVEFWQGRENRLHDRIQYNLTKDRKWEIVRLAP